MLLSCSRARSGRADLVGSVFEETGSRGAGDLKKQHERLEAARSMRRAGEAPGFPLESFPKRIRAIPLSLVLF